MTPLLLTIATAAGYACTNNSSPQTYLLRVQNPAASVPVGDRLDVVFTIEPTPTGNDRVSWERVSGVEWSGLPEATSMRGRYVLSTRAPAGSSKADFEATFTAVVNSTRTNPVTSTADIDPIRMNIHPVPDWFNREGSWGNRRILMEVPASILPPLDMSVGPSVTLWVDTSLLGPEPQGFVTDARFWDPSATSGRATRIGPRRGETAVGEMDSGELVARSGRDMYEQLQQDLAVWVELNPRKSQEVYAIHRFELTID